VCLDICTSCLFGTNMNSYRYFHPLYKSLIEFKVRRTYEFIRKHPLNVMNSYVV